MASQGKISNSSRMALSPRQIDWFLHKESNIKKSSKGLGVEWGRKGLGVEWGWYTLKEKEQQSFKAFNP